MKGWVKGLVAFLIFASLVLVAVIAFTARSRVEPEASPSIDTPVSTSASPTPTPTPTSASPSPTPTPTVTTSSGPAQDEVDEQLPDEDDVYVPADDADVHAAEYNALVARCGNKLNESPTVRLAKGDKADFVLKGKGKAVRSRKQYECIVMTTPTVGHMWIAGWEKEKTASGRSFGQVNTWQPAFLKASKPSLAEAWVVKDDTGKLFVSEAYQKEAFKVVTLLRRFDDQGIKTKVAEWHRPLLAEKVEGLPTTIKSNKDYRGRFIVLAYTIKGQQCPRVVYLVNVDDGRMAKAKFTCGEPKPQVRIPTRTEPPRRTQPPSSPPTTRPPTTQPPTTTRPAKTANPVDGQPEPESHPDPSQSADER